MQPVAKRTLTRTFLALLYLVFLAGCAIQLAPPYDKVVVDGLNAANTDAMTLFAEVRNGTVASTFPKREDKYTALIGKLDALAIAAAARPMPSGKVNDAITKELAKRGALGDFKDTTDAPPSVHAIEKISETFERMRTQDKTKGLSVDEVKAFRGQASIYFDQAITYENFLKR